MLNLAHRGSLLEDTTSLIADTEFATAAQAGHTSVLKRSARFRLMTIEIGSELITQTLTSFT